jgi:hypothetical protein
MAGKGSKPGERRGGRQKGTRNKATLESAARAAVIARSGLTPLEYMLERMRDDKEMPAIRADMAKAAAPYVHPKLANIEHTGKDGGPIQIEYTL